MENRGSQLIKTIFDTDNFFMRVCEKILDLATVNLLFLLSCLPLVTIGIAKISLYQTLFEIKKNRRVKVVALYVRAFRENWRLGLKLGLLELGIVGISLFDLFLFWYQSSLAFQFMKAICIALILLTTVLYLCAYPLAARRELTFQEILQSSLVLVSLNFPWFFIMMATIAAVLMVLYSSGLVFLLGLALFIVIGFAGLAFLQLNIIEHVFNKYEKE